MQLHRIAKFAHWPQPADDKGPADITLTLDDGVQMPYTPRKPRSVEPYGPAFDKCERWPVLLTDEEKTQVAVARFFEIHPVSRAWQEQNRKQAANDQEKTSVAAS